MNPILVRAVSAGRKVAQQAVKQWSSGSWNVKEKSVPNAAKKQLQAATRGKVALEASSSRTVGEAIMGWWMWAMKNIFWSIVVRMSLPAEIAISTASNHSRRMPNEGSQSLIVFPDIHFVYTSKNVSSDLITEKKISMVQH